MCDRTCTRKSILCTSDSVCLLHGLGLGARARAVGAWGGGGSPRIGADPSTTANPYCCRASASCGIGHVFFCSATRSTAAVLGCRVQSVELILGDRAHCGAQCTRHIPCRLSSAWVACVHVPYAPLTCAWRANLLASPVGKSASLASGACACDAWMWDPMPCCARIRLERLWRRA